MNPQPPNYLYVFLDEGGNLDFSSTGTKYFSLSAITVVRPFLWESPLTSLKYKLLEMGVGIEYFHAAEDRQAVRDSFFDITKNFLPDIRTDSLIVKKRKTGPALRVEERFYPEMIGYLLRYVLDSRNTSNVDEIIVMTDSIPVKRKKNAVEKAVKLVLAKMLPINAKYQVLHHASKSCVGLQVADYFNWAILRKWEKGDRRSYDLISSSVKSEFEIFRAGTHYYY